MSRKHSSTDSPKSVLITGGAGFIGSHLADLCLEKKWKVVVVDDLSSGSKKWLSSQVVFYQSDLNNQSELKKILLTHQPNIIFHCAGHTQLRIALHSPYRDAQTNIGSTLSLIQVLLDVKTSSSYAPDQIVFSSTSAVYGGCENPPFSEKDQPHPTNPYGIAKLTAEQYLQWYGSQTRTTVTQLRYANVYGSRQSAQGEAGVVAKFVSNLLTHKPLEVFGKGDHQRDYIYVEDVVAANLAVVEKKVGGVYNVGTGRPTTTLALAQKVAQLIKPKAEILSKMLEVTEQPFSYLDSTLLTQKTDWKPHVSLDKGLEKTLKWYQENEH